MVLYGQQSKFQNMKSTFNNAKLHLTIEDIQRLESIIHYFAFYHFLTCQTAQKQKTDGSYVLSLEDDGSQCVQIFIPQLFVKTEMTDKFLGLREEFDAIRDDAMREIKKYASEKDPGK